MTDAENDILWREYFYPGTDVLINYYGVKDHDKLKEVEATNSFDRLVELQDHPLELGCGKEHLNAIHKYIFEDVYPFAGKYRKVNMKKSRGAFLSIASEKDIELYLDELFESVNNKMMYCHSKYELCDILAEIYNEIIYCHPYREGNGRAAREFVREFTLQKSEEIGLGKLDFDWRKVNQEELNRYIEVNHIFRGPTAMLFMDALVPATKKEK